MAFFAVDGCLEKQEFTNHRRSWQRPSIDRSVDFGTPTAPIVCDVTREKTLAQLNPAPGSTPESITEERQHQAGPDKLMRVLSWSRSRVVRGSFRI
jgi:hypothetical protein